MQVDQRASARGRSRMAVLTTRQARTHDFPLLKAPERPILVSRRPGIGGMSVRDRLLTARSNGATEAFDKMCSVAAC